MSAEASIPKAFATSTNSITSSRRSPVSYLARLEQARLAARMSQQQLAEKLGVSQGHYSKVATAKVAIGDAMRESAQTWLKAQGPDGTASDVTKRMQELAASIRRECTELMQLAGVIGGESDDLRAKDPR